MLAFILHIKSLPMRFTGHASDKRNICINLLPSCIQQSGAVNSSLTICPEALIDELNCPLKVTNGNSSLRMTELIAPESTINNNACPSNIISSRGSLEMLPLVQHQAKQVLHCIERFFPFHTHQKNRISKQIIWHLNRRKNKIGLTRLRTMLPFPLLASVAPFFTHRQVSRAPLGFRCPFSFQEMETLFFSNVLSVRNTSKHFLSDLISSSLILSAARSLGSVVLAKKNCVVMLWLCPFSYLGKS